MKWLKSTTQKSWYAMGHKIPACVTPNNEYLQLEDSECTKMTAIPVIASLVKAGGIIILNEEPAELKNSVEALQGDKAALTARITQLEEQLKNTQPVDVEAIKAEAQEEIKAQAIAELQEKEDRIKELEKQLKAAKKANKED